MNSIALSRTSDLKHHVIQGSAWLAQSAGSTNTAALSYAAFEFRLAIERVGVHYWAELLSRRLEEQDLRDIASFKRIENRIYQLAGHQKEIDAHFEFMRIVLGLLKIGQNLSTPQLGQLSGYWHDCSKLCHIGWTLLAGDPGVLAEAYASMKAIEASLSEQISGLVTWPRITDPAFAELRARFVAAQATAVDVQLYLEARGAWARAEYTDGRPAEFVGEPIAPAASKQST